MNIHSSKTRPSTTRVTVLLAHALVVGLVLVAGPVAADRFWDVKEKKAEAIAENIQGKVVVEYCPGCDGGDFNASLIVKASVGKGDYSDGNQVKIARGKTFVGIYDGSSTLQFRGCRNGIPSGDAAFKKMGFEPERLDIPYAHVLDDDSFQWVGDGLQLMSGSSSSSSKVVLDDAGKKLLEACLGISWPTPRPAQAAARFIFSNKGTLGQKQIHSIDVDGDGKNEKITWALVEGALVRDVLPPRQKKITVRFFEMRLKKSSQLLLRQALPQDIAAQGPHADISDVRAGVVFVAKKSGTSPGGFGVLISSPQVDDFVFVEVTKKARKRSAMMHVLGRWPRAWDGALSSEAGTLVIKGTGKHADKEAKFDVKVSRFLSKTMRWAAGDELNARVRAKAGTKKLGTLDVGDVSAFDTGRDSDGSWTPVTLASGHNAYVSSRFMDDAAQMFEVSAGAADGRGVRRMATLAEAKLVDFNADQLRRIRRLGSKVLKVTKPKQICAVLKEAKKLEDELQEPFFVTLFNNDKTDWDAGNRAARHLSAGSRTLDFFVMSEGSVVNTQARRLGARLPRKKAERKLLQATDALAFDLFPVWIEQTNDFGGCTRPQRAKSSLRWLKSSWSRAPTCLRKILKPHLQQALENLAASRCFCESRPVATKSVNSTAKLLLELDAFDGAVLSAKWKKTLAGVPTENFNSACVP